MNFIRTILAVCALLTGIITGVRADEVDDYILSQMKKAEIPGLALAVIQNGKPVKVKGYGVSDTKSKKPVTLDTVFEIGSVSKPITASAIHLLAEKGRINYDFPITRYFAMPPPSWKPITVRHLLSHTSGIRDYTSEISKSSEQVDWTEDQLFVRAAVQPLNFKPGEKFKYSHTNYLLLGLIIRSVSAVPFDKYVKDNIFKPLDMTYSRSVAEEKPAADVATGYQINDGSVQPAEQEKRAYADAFVATSASDMAKFAAALDKGTFLNSYSREIMWNPNVVNGKESIYGMGWYTESLKGHRAIGHGGSVGGFSANYTRFPDDNLSVVILTNLKDVNVFPLVRGVAAKYAPALK